MRKIRRLGDGYEPYVDELDGKLIYSLPVDSGFLSFSFSFEISTDDLSVLETVPYRRAVLEIVAHTILQNSTLPGREEITQHTFDAIVSQVLHAAPAALRNYVDTFGKAHNICIDIFVNQAIARRAGEES